MSNTDPEFYDESPYNLSENNDLTCDLETKSILKPPKARVPLQDIGFDNSIEPDIVRKRRVSFAGVRTIKEFHSEAESHIICNTPAYEITFSTSSDSSAHTLSGGSVDANDCTLMNETMELTDNSLCIDMNNIVYKSEAPCSQGTGVTKSGNKQNFENYLNYPMPQGNKPQPSDPTRILVNELLEDSANLEDTSLFQAPIETDLKKNNPLPHSHRNSVNKQYESYFERISSLNYNKIHHTGNPGNHFFTQQDPDALIHSVTSHSWNMEFTGALHSNFGFPVNHAGSFPSQSNFSDMELTKGTPIHDDALKCKQQLYPQSNKFSVGKSNLNAGVVLSSSDNQVVGTQGTNSNDSLCLKSDLSDKFDTSQGMEFTELVKPGMIFRADSLVKDIDKENNTVPGSNYVGPGNSTGNVNNQANFNDGSRMDLTMVQEIKPTAVNVVQNSYSKVGIVPDCKEALGLIVNRSVQMKDFETSQMELTEAFPRKIRKSIAYNSASGSETVSHTTEVIPTEMEKSGVFNLFYKLEGMKRKNSLHSFENESFAMEITEALPTKIGRNMGVISVSGPKILENHESLGTEFTPVKIGENVDGKPFGRAKMMVNDESFGMEYTEELPVKLEKNEVDNLVSEKKCMENRESLGMEFTEAVPNNIKKIMNSEYISNFRGGDASIRNESCGMEFTKAVPMHECLFKPDTVNPSNSQACDNLGWKDQFHYMKSGDHCDFETSMEFTDNIYMQNKNFIPRYETCVPVKGKTTTQDNLPSIKTITLQVSNSPTCHNSSSNLPPRNALNYSRNQSQMEFTEAVPHIRHFEKNSATTHRINENFIETEVTKGIVPCHSEKYTLFDSEVGSNNSCPIAVSKSKFSESANDGIQSNNLFRESTSVLGISSHSVCPENKNCSNSFGLLNIDNQQDDYHSSKEKNDSGYVPQSSDSSKSAPMECAEEVQSGDCEEAQAIETKEMYCNRSHNPSQAFRERIGPLQEVENTSQVEFTDMLPVLKETNAAHVQKQLSFSEERKELLELTQSEPILSLNTAPELLSRSRNHTVTAMEISEPCATVEESTKPNKMVEVLQPLQDDGMSFCDVSCMSVDDSFVEIPNKNDQISMVITNAECRKEIEFNVSPANLQCEVNEPEEKLKQNHPNVPGSSDMPSNKLSNSPVTMSGFAENRFTSYFENPQHQKQDSILKESKEEKERRIQERWNIIKKNNSFFNARSFTFLSRVLWKYSLPWPVDIVIKVPLSEANENSQILKVSLVSHIRKNDKHGWLADFCMKRILTLILTEEWLNRECRTIKNLLTAIKVIEDEYKPLRFFLNSLKAIRLENLWELKNNRIIFKFMNSQRMYNIDIFVNIDDFKKLSGKDIEVVNRHYNLPWKLSESEVRHLFDKIQPSSNRFIEFIGGIKKILPS